MAWFGKKGDKRDATEPASTVDQATGIDFSKYELDQLGNDIRSIVDVPGAVMQALKVVLLVPLIVAVLTWVVFSSRMSAVAFVPFLVIAVMLSFLGAFVLGGYFVARRRLDLVAGASNRVVDVIGEMHTDVMLVKDGHAGTSVQGVAIGLLENAIFPAVFGTLTTTAETAMGPLGRFSTNLTKAPMSMVQNSVISAVRSLPDKEIGQMVTDAGDAMPAAAAGIARLDSEYQKARERVENIVSTVSRTALGSTLGFAAVATVPLLIWLAIGWVLS